MAKRRLKKKEIREDQLVTFALRTSTFVQEHFTQVLSGVLILIAAVVIIMFTANARRNTARAAERELAIAMSQYQVGDKDLAGTSFANLVDRYSSHSAGVTAMYFLGECHLANFRYQEALDAYERYLSSAPKDAPFRKAAHVGKAMCYEGIQDFGRAAETLEKVAAGMDEDDSRYYDVMFDAATFYREAGEREKSSELYRRVSENATPPLSERATVWLNLLQ